jgi:hypothetical protein
MVDVEADHRERVVVAPRLAHGDLPELVEGTAVAHPGELVGSRLRFGGRTRDLELVRELARAAERGGERARRAIGAGHVDHRPERHRAREHALLEGEGDRGREEDQDRVRHDADHVAE